MNVTSNFQTESVDSDAGKLEWHACLKFIRNCQLFADHCLKMVVRTCDYCIGWWSTSVLTNEFDALILIAIRVEVWTCCHSNTGQRASCSDQFPLGRFQMWLLISCKHLLVPFGLWDKGWHVSKEDNTSVPLENINSNQGESLWVAPWNLLKVFLALVKLGSCNGLSLFRYLLMCPTSFWCFEV